MPKKKKLIDKAFAALIGEVVIGFGQVEDGLRYALSTTVCPAIGYPTGMALFARTRFIEMLELYEFAVLYAIQQCFENEVISVKDKDDLSADLRALRNALASINERRNIVVHSAYQETGTSNNDGSKGDTVLEGIKPFLHRRIIEDAGEFFTSHERIQNESTSLIADIRDVSLALGRFDRSIIPFTNWMWQNYAAGIFAIQTPPIHMNSTHRIMKHDLIPVYDAD